MQIYNFHIQLKIFEVLVKNLKNYSSDIFSVTKKVLEENLSHATSEVIFIANYFCK